MIKLTSLLPQFAKKRLKMVSSTLANAHKSETEKPSSRHKRKFCFIINPSKKNAKNVQSTIEHLCKEYGIKHYAFKDTTPEFPGNQQAFEAIEDGCEVIVACGGDGTVRSVACAVAKYADKPQPVEVGVIPIGTANILARNINLPVDDIEACTKIALESAAHPFDIGFVKCIEEPDFEHAFTIISGVGMDAKLIERTEETQKSQIGFLAYFIGGVKELFSKKTHVEISLTRPDGSTLHTVTKLRSLMVGNCGKIPWFQLIPDAKFDDGILDATAIDTTAGFIGWSQLAIDVGLQRLGVKSTTKYRLGRIEHIQVKRIGIKLNHDTPVQLDGDIIRNTREISIRVHQHAIDLRYVKQTST